MNAASTTDDRTPEIRGWLRRLGTVFSGTLYGNASSLFAARLVYAVCQWGLLSITARVGGKAMVGQYVLAAAVIAPVMAFAALNLRALQASDSRREHPFRAYFSLRIICLSAALAVISWIAWSAGYSSEVWSIVLAMSAAAMAESISDVCYGACQQQERLDRVAISIVVKSVIALACFAAVLAVTRQLVWALTAVAIVRTTILLVWDIPQAIRVLREVEPDAGRAAFRPTAFRPSQWAPLAWQAFPMGLVMMFISLHSAAPRYFIESHLGEEALGVFGPIAYFSLVGALAVQALGHAITPRLSRAAAEGNRSEFFQLFWRLAAVGAALGVLGVLIAVLLGRPVLWLAYGGDYVDQQLVLVWIMLASVAAYPASFAGYALTAARCFRAQVPLFATVAGATALGCVFLVPRYGLAGAAAAMAASSVLQLALSLVILVYVVRAPQVEPDAEGGAA